MMARIAHSALGLAAAAAALAVAEAPARAQCRLCDKPTTQAGAEAAEDSVSLEIEAGLDFDRLIVLGPGEGTATLRPDGSRQVSGTIESIGGRAMVGEARVSGEPGRAVRIDLPLSIQLYSTAGRRLAISDIVTDLPALPRLDSAGHLKFRFGGRIEVSGEVEGDYRGDLPITVEYL